MKNFFENGWGFVLLFAAAVGILVAWQSWQGPWTSATVRVPGSEIVLRYALRPSLLPGGKEARRLEILQADHALRLIAQGEQLSPPLALFILGNKKASSIRLRGTDLDLRLNLSTFKTGGVARPSEEKLLGLFEQTGTQVHFKVIKRDKGNTLALAFKRRGLNSPLWTKHLPLVPSPLVRPNPISINLKSPKNHWRQDVAFLKGLLKQHAPGLFSKHRVPASSDRRGLWKEKIRSDGSTRFITGGDFNGDRKKDYAFILPMNLSAGFGVFCLLSTPEGDYGVHRLSQGQGRPQRFALDTVSPGDYLNTEKPDQRVADPFGSGLLLQTDSLRFSRVGRWSSIFYWDAADERFRDLTENE